MHPYDVTPRLWTQPIDKPSVFELNREVSPEGRQLVIRFRLLSLAGLFLAILAGAVLAR